MSPFNLLQAPQQGTLFALLNTPPLLLGYK